jgi:hypothetical protein
VRELVGVTLQVQFVFRNKSLFVPSSQAACEYPTDSLLLVGCDREGYVSEGASLKLWTYT